MFKVLTNPQKTIEHAKKNKNIQKTVWTIIVAAAILTIASLIGIVVTSTANATTYIRTILTILILSIIAQFFIAWLNKIALKTITKKGNYYDSLTAFALGFMIMAIASLINVILGLIPIAGILIGTIVMIIALILSMSVTLRTLIELTGADTLHIIIALATVYFAIFITAVTIAGQFMTATLPI